MFRSIATLMICILLLSSMGGLSYGQTSGQVESPRQTTIFLTDPAEVEQMDQSLSETYYDTGDTQAFPLDEATQKVKNLTEGLDSLEKQIKKLDAKYGISNPDYSKTRKDVIAIIASINQTKTKLAASLKKILYFKQSIFESAEQIKEIRATLDQTTDYMQRFSTFIYETSNEYYDTNGKIDEIKLFIKSDPESNMAEQLANTAMIENIMSDMNTLIDSLKKDEKETIIRIRESNKNRMRLNEIINEYNDRLSNLEEQKDFLTNYLKFYESNDNTQALSLEFPGLFDNKPEVLHSITEMVAQIEKKSYDTASFDVVKKLEELAATEAFATRDEKASPFSSPIYPIVKIDKYFNDPNDQKEFEAPYPGIKIAAPQGTPLYATNEGLVYKIANQNGIGISRIAIINKSGEIVIYMYPNKIAVKEGDIVRRGQFIGYSGGEPGTKGAGFAGGGPNLTFLVIKNGKFANPLDYLDLSVIQDRSNLPSSYQFKFLKNKYDLPREGYKIKPFTGESIAERRENFLNTYAVGAYRQVELWQKAVEGTNIDIDLPICIAQAESSMGRHLSTANNIGNVGNNDRGDRVSYASPLIGARLIATTLNNQYLGKYHTVADYNGYYNKTGPHYATSPQNRQTNVIRCLTLIKGYYIPEEYPVRNGVNPNLSN